MLNPNFTQINAKQEEADPDSVLQFYRKLIALRNGSKALQYGNYRPLWTEHDQLFAYEHALDGETFTIVCNLSGSSAALPKTPAGERVLGNINSGFGATMLPYEARVLKTK